MNETRQLRSTWTENLKEYLQKPRTDPYTVQDFDRTLARCLKGFVSVAADDVRPFLQDPRKQDAVKERLETRAQQVLDDQRGEAQKLKGTYRNIHTQWSGLRDQRKQHNWATTRDYLKLFASRTASAVMIATVVLAASYCAKELGIPLPYFRIAP